MEEDALDITHVNAPIGKLEMAIDGLELGVVKIASPSNILITPSDCVDGAHVETSRRREECNYVCLERNAICQTIMHVLISCWCRDLRRLVIFDVSLPKMAAAQNIADATYAKPNPADGNISDSILLTISTITSKCLL